MFKQVRLNDALLKFYQRTQPVAFSNAETLYDDLIILRDQIIAYGGLSDSIVEYLNNFIDKYDDNLFETVDDILSSWLNTGFLTDFIRELINEEVIQSRGGFTNLNNRLNSLRDNNIGLSVEIDKLTTLVDTAIAELANKTSKEYVDNLFDSIVSGSPKETFTTLAELTTAYPTGASGVYLVTDNNALYYYRNNQWEYITDYIATNIANESIGNAKIKVKNVTKELTDFVSYSDNKFFRDNLKKGYVINITGDEEVNSTFGVTDRLFIKPSSSVSVLGVSSIAFFNEEGSFIVRSGDNSATTNITPTTYIAPNNAYSMICNIRLEGEYYLNNEIRINLSGEVLPFSLGGGEFKYNVKGENINHASINQNASGVDSVTGLNTDFTYQSTNLFDYSKITLRQLYSQTGELTENISYGYHGKIYTRGDKQHILKGLSHIALFDKNDQFIQRINLSVEPTVVNLPNNTAYYYANFQRFTTDLDEGTIQINRGATLLPFEKYYTELKDTVSNKYLKHFNESTNIFDIDSVIHGYVTNASGEVIKNGSFFTQYDIDVRDVKSLSTIGLVYIIQKRIDGSFISRVNATELVTLNPQTRLIDICGQYYNEHVVNRTARVNKGEVLLAFEPYYIKMNGIKHDDRISIHEFKESLSFSDLTITPNDLYTADTIPAKPNMVDFLPSEQYANFDSLVSQYSNLTKHTLGKDQSGEHDIHYYTSKTSDVPETIDNGKPVIIIISGIHGYEKTHPYILYHAIKQINEKKDSKLIPYSLVNDVELVIVPCANPWSWSSNSRANSRGVDIARNFEYRFANADAPAPFTKGDFALSEKESQYIDAILREYQDRTVFFTSLHNFTVGTENENQLIWVPSSDKQTDVTAKKFLSLMSGKWKKENPLFSDYDYYGYTDRNAPLGSESKQATLYGIKGCTYELSNILRIEAVPSYASELVLTLGCEALVNFLYIMYKENLSYIKEHGKIDYKFDIDSL